MLAAPAAWPRPVPPVREVWQFQGSLQGLGAQECRKLGTLGGTLSKEPYWLLYLCIYMYLYIKGLYMGYIYICIYGSGMLGPSDLSPILQRQGLCIGIIWDPYGGATVF